MCIHLVNELFGLVFEQLVDFLPPEVDCVAQPIYLELMRRATAPAASLIVIYSLNRIA